MFPFKFNKRYIVRANFSFVILFFALLFFNAKSQQANAAIISSPKPVINDTIPGKITNSTHSPLVLLPFAKKTICDLPFNAEVTGGFGTRTYKSSNPAVATIDKYGQIVIQGIPGQTYISVSDQTGSPPAQLLDIEAIQKPTITISPLNEVVCDGASVTFTATTGNVSLNVTYQWLVNNAAVPENTNNAKFSSNALHTGDQITCVITDNDDHCIVNSTAYSAPATVTVYPYTSPAVNISALPDPDGAIESGKEIIFTASPSFNPPNANANPLFNYQWKVNNNDAGTNSPIYKSNCAQNGDVVTCVLTPTNIPCLTAFSVISQPIKLNIINTGLQVSATISASANGVYAGTLINFTAILTNANPIAYEWQINGIDTNITTATLSTFKLKNNDEVRCIIFTDNGCKQVLISNVIKMIIYPTPEVIIPNTFTPNGDGINDLWELKYLYLYRYCKVYIYNRYGALLFQSKGYGAPWDGKYKGQGLPAGTYYYVIDLGIHAPLLSGSINIVK